MKFRTYPRVDMSKISNWICALSDYGLPLIELSSRKLAERETKGTLSASSKAKLVNWKRANGLEDADELEYKYLLEGIGAIRTRPLGPQDMSVPLSQGITMQDILGVEYSRIKLYYLTRLGSQLFHYWNCGDYYMYETFLFWLLIRSKNFNPLVQKTLADRRIYEIGLQDEFIPSQDGISRILVRKWLQYFGLVKENHVNQSRLSIILLYCSTLEINEMLSQEQKLKEYVANICDNLATSFSISEAAIDFSSLLDCLYSRTDRQIIAGFPSGRGHRGLPSKPTVQILEINSPIPLSSINTVKPLGARKAVVFGGSS